jgi:hypothetical protein
MRDGNAECLYRTGPGIADATCVYVRDEGNVCSQDSNHALTAGFRMTW